MGPAVWRHLTLGFAFVDFGLRYWLLTFPHARRAVRRCMRCAEDVPDTGLRRAAIETLVEERGNLDGAAAFAVYAPRRYRRTMVEALVSFQAIYDFADTLAERMVLDRAANAQTLHQALLDVLSDTRRASLYYAHCDVDDDGGYLDGLVGRCQGTLIGLPSYAMVERSLRRAVRRMIDYQTLIHGDGALPPNSLARWARSETPTASGLWWWETAAAGASSLVAFALIAAAARSTLAAHDVAAIEDAYFPWFGALHVLLDSLVDYRDDELSGHHSLVAHYASPQAAAARMEAIGAAAARSARVLPDARQHMLLLTAMTGFYLAKPSAHALYAAETTGRLLAVLGELAWPVMLVHRVRQRVGSGLGRN